MLVIIVMMDDYILVSSKFEFQVAHSIKKEERIQNSLLLLLYGNLIFQFIYSVHF